MIEKDDLKLSRRRVYTPYNGKIMLNSYNEFDTPDDALAYWWAAAKCQDPFQAMLYAGLDGMQSNDHLGDKPIPDRLLGKVKDHIRELDEIALDAVAEQDRQWKDWRP
jgi:hypothetical protein